ncbi:MAG: hypothetical protein HY211_07440 [Candidatus Omnitrophica bacterium]|nr:hypothetical protein [Candidatus Omnitrophota bacterium]
MRFWKETGVVVLTVGIMTMLMFVLGAGAESLDVQRLITAHREAAVQAQKNVAVHEEMEKKFTQGRGGAKIDMVGHCRYWADYYRKLAAREEQAAKELEP